MEKTKLSKDTSEYFNEPDVRSSYRFFAHEESTEIRLIDPKKKEPPKSIFVTNEDDFVKECQKYNGKYNIYAGINERKINGTTANDVISTRSTIIDIDAIRAKGYEKDAATEEELKRAEILADQIITDAKKHGFKIPAKNMSGNGYQLWFSYPKIKVSDEKREQINNKLRKFQSKMIKRYSYTEKTDEEKEKIDLDKTLPKGDLDNMGDLPRIIKVIGTLSIKGDNTPERPFRTAYSCTSFTRNEDGKLIDEILSQSDDDEAIPENKIQDIEISNNDEYPPCIKYLLFEHENKDGKGWERIINLLAAYFRQLGWLEDKTIQTVQAWNNRQPYHEPGEEFEIVHKVKHIYKKEIQCPLCLTIQKNGGYPYFAFQDLCICHPDDLCKNDKTKGPLGYTYWKKQETPIEIQNLENLNPEQYEDKKIKCKGSILRIKKHDRVTQATYKCSNIQCDYKKIVPGLLPKSERICEKCDNELILDKKKTTSGFMISLINDLTNIASSVTVKMFASCKALGIHLNPAIKEQADIGKVLNKIGKTVEIEGTYKTVDKFDKNIQKWTTDSELEAEKINFVDYLKEFSLTSKKYQELNKYFSTKEWGDEFIDSVINPEIKGRILTKKFMLLTALTVKEIGKIGKKGIFGIGRGAIFGDPGESKSLACRRFIDTYCEGLNALKITTETLSMAGLKGGVTKDTDGSYEIDWGILPWCHNGMLIMDGYHSFDKQNIASLRETETNNTIDIFKIVKGSRECAFRGIKIANIRQQPIRKYYDTKYDASFQIGYGEIDQENKFDDADRRRVDWIEVYSEEDVLAETVDQSQFRLLTGEHMDPPVEEIKELIKFSWTRTSENIDPTSLAALTPLISSILKRWREQYPGIKLSILGKEGAIIFSKYLIASAILHFRVNEQGNIQPDYSDVEYVQNIYEEMFKSLEIDKRIKLSNFNDVLALAIYKKMTEEQKNLFHKLGKAGSVTHLCKEIGFTRETFYTRFREKVGIETPEGYYIPDYSFFNGFFNGLVKVAPISDNGIITELGRLVLNIHKNILRKNEDLKKGTDSDKVLPSGDNLTPSFECQIVEMGSSPSNNASTGGELTNLTELTHQGKLERYKKDGMVDPNIISNNILEEEEEEKEEEKEEYGSVSTVRSVSSSVPTPQEADKLQKKNLTPKSECQIVPNQLQQKEAKGLKNV